MGLRGTILLSRLPKATLLVGDVPALTALYNDAHRMRDWHDTGVAPYQTVDVVVGRRRTVMSSCPRVFNRDALAAELLPVRKGEPLVRATQRALAEWCELLETVIASTELVVTWNPPPIGLGMSAAVLVRQRHPSDVDGSPCDPHPRGWVSQAIGALRSDS